MHRHQHRPHQQHTFYDDIGKHCYTLNARVHLPTLNLRKFNNEKKLQLLKRFVWPNAVLLDLAGGKGGDLNKFAQVKCSVVHLVDKSEASIVEAIRRSQHADPPYPFTFSAQLASMLDKAAYPVAPNMVDVVNCQFALHYVPPEKLPIVLAYVSYALRTGGVFLVTTVVEQRVRNFRNNKLARVSFVSPTAYRFTLDGAVDEMEFIVSKAKLLDVAEQLDLKLIHYAEHCTSTRRAPLSWQEREIADLYCEYVFKKE